MSEDIVDKLRWAACGHPFAKIYWPHRVMHEAADEIERLRKALVIDDVMIDRLLRVRYPDEWPDDKVFDEVRMGGTETFREECFRDARNELEAALSQGEPKR